MTNRQSELKKTSSLTHSLRDFVSTDTKEEAESKLRQAQSALATVNELEESLKESQEEKQRLKGT